ncbi:ribbon-helix-helix protein, CopG family [Sphingomonas mesophila]|uniref:ribbon-helix-helix protein, CopG family n=1 Tax=Sphingomonas mesophila TaxID=2303576 RepID=UPI000E5915E3|nr:ribbon-helix-helix protein, CopG family [Sphingomonas mesophila]
MSNFPLRIDEDVMATVKRAAAREEESMNMMIEILLREALHARNMRIVGPRNRK